MDRTDYQILNILQKDCRTTLKHIGDQVGLTAPAVSERVRRMEEKGVIRGFRIDVERERLDCSMTGFIFVAVEPEKYNTFCEFCEKSSAIVSHYHVIGVFNALLRFAVRGRGNWMNFSLPLSDTETHRLRWSSKLILRPKKSRRLADLT